MSAAKGTACRASYTDTIAERTCATNIFSGHGIPENFWSDEGTQFTSWEFQQFARDYGISHSTSIPICPQSNGAAESSAAVSKNILMKSQDSNIGLLAYQATPLESGFSLAELLFGLYKVQQIQLDQWHQSEEVRSMMVQPFDWDTPPRHTREESTFRGFPTDEQGEVYSKAEEEAHNKAEEACSRTRRERKIVPPQRLDLTCS
ncbi:hypothetical protein PR048_005679 [Dryococelus australis]|uniref:Integrase catalytic domain-containing protein n=1 Tax=Dryococelus australis TaxID=614101 RepID=A0ABQ9I8X6_9NEOP|nr:hypothetical protein PR048_005679 [Dryococelus australis]